MGGWELHPFNLHFFPRKKPKDFRKLQYYCQYFDTVEINVTFYKNLLNDEQPRKWMEDVSENKNFIFTVKLFHGFTHTYDATTRDVHAVQQMLDRFSMENKLGGLIIQFPFSFVNGADERKYLGRLAEAFSQYRAFVELRHDSWNKPALFEFLQKNNLHYVNVDLPKLEHHMPFHEKAWDNVAYFRMMGRNTKTWKEPWRLEEDKQHMVSDRYLYKYDDSELLELLKRVERVRKLADIIYVIYHNDPNANSLFNGFKLRHLIENKKVNIPERLIKVHPDLARIAAPVDSKDSLF